MILHRKGSELYMVRGKLIFKLLINNNKFWFEKLNKTLPTNFYLNIIYFMHNTPIMYATRLDMKN